MNTLRPSVRRETFLNFKYVFQSRPSRFGDVARRNLCSTRQCRASQVRRRREAPRKTRSGDKFDVNVFEEKIVGNQHKRRRLTEEDLERDLEEDQKLEDDILNLEKGMGAFKVSEEESEEMKRSVFTDEELARIEEEDVEGVDMSPHHIISQRMLPMQAHVYLQRLNEALDNAIIEHDRYQKKQRLVWRWYTRCKTNVPGFTSMIPKQGWDVLWQTQVPDVTENPDRLAHLAEIADDKTAAGWQLSPEERYAQIEGTFMGGDQVKALQLFEEALVGEDASNTSLVEMGARMYAYHGRPERAHELVDRLFELDNGADPRILSLLVRAYAEQRNENSALVAWSLYHEMKKRLSTDMQMPEYDMIVLGFLNSGQTDFALAVFRDMMVRGEQERRASHESAFSKLSRFIDLTRSPQETTEFSLDAIKFLPRRFQNRFFYASWLRKLISEGQVNAAEQVVELMYERGVKPDAKHMNGIIAAWLRDDRSSQWRRAEELGWTLIQRRLDFVQGRRLTEKTEALSTGTITDVRSLSVNENTSVQIPVSLTRPVPPATIETFCILSQHYVNQGSYAHAYHLQHLLDPAEIQMNAFFMNQLLYAENRTRGPSEAWKRFLHMSKDVKLDLGTWEALWHCEKRHVYDNQGSASQDFPAPRYLFNRMMRWLRTLQAQDRRRATEDLDEEAYHTIVQAFGLYHDLPGTFVAMHTLRENFGVAPPESVVRTLLYTLTKHMPQNLTERQRKDVPRRTLGRTKLKQDNERKMVAATYLLDTVRQERLNAFADQGIEYDDLSAEAQAEENHKMCLAMLVRVMQERFTNSTKSSMSNEDSQRIQVAAEECGVEHIDVEHALEVNLSHY